MGKLFGSVIGREKEFGSALSCKYSVSGPEAKGFKGRDLVFQNYF